MNDPVVAVFTSTPFSVEHAEASIRSILRQTRPPDTIRWHLPLRSKRFKQEYPAVPAWFAAYNDRVQLVRCGDDGPATKFMPLLETECLATHKRVMIFDDDTVYPSTALEALLRQCDGRDVGVGVLGQTFPWVPGHYAKRQSFTGNTGIWFWNQVQVLLASEMVVVPTRVLACTREKMLELQGVHPLMFVNDDHLLAARAHQVGVRLYVVASTLHEAQRENKGMLTGTNYPKKLQYFMIARGMVPFPVADAVMYVTLALVVVWVVKRLRR